MRRKSCASAPLSTIHAQRLVWDRTPVPAVSGQRLTAQVNTAEAQTDGSQAAGTHYLNPRNEMD